MNRKKLIQRIAHKFLLILQQTYTVIEYIDQNNENESSFDVKVLIKQKCEESKMNIRRLIEIEDEIEYLDMKHINNRNDVNNLIIYSIFLFGISAFLLNGIGKVLITLYAPTFFTLLSVLIIGGINTYVILKTYQNLCLKNEEFVNYKAKRKELIRDFRTKYNQVDVNIAWFEMLNNYQIEVFNELTRTNAININKINEIYYDKVECDDNSYSLVKKYKNKN